MSIPLLRTPLIRLLTVVLLAGATLLLLFIIFSGSVSSSPFNRFYWVQARTGNLDPNGDISRWTFWGICHPATYDSHSNGKCTSLGPAQPISPYDNFGNSTSLPHDFVSNRDTYYYLSRFSFPFILIALVFTGFSLMFSLVQLCWWPLKPVTTLFICLSVLFCTAGVCCQTAVSVMVRNKFSDAGMSAKVGASMLGMSWAAVACLLIVFFLACGSGVRRMYKTHREQRQLEMGQAGPAGAPLSQPVSGPLSGDEGNHGTLPSNEGGIRFFKIKRTRKAIDEESL